MKKVKENRLNTESDLKEYNGLLKYLFTLVSVSGCAESSLLHTGFL